MLDVKFVRFTDSWRTIVKKSDKQNWLSTKKRSHVERLHMTDARQKENMSIRNRC